jgi:hypothetical protein
VSEGGWVSKGDCGMTLCMRMGTGLRHVKYWVGVLVCVCIYSGSCLLDDG